MSAYDTHQRLRTKAIRQLKKKSYDDAIKTISDGAIQMLEQKEQGSGCDLAVYLIDVYDQSGKACDKETREPLVKIISLAQNDFWRKKVIDAAVKWSVKATRNPAGDGFLRLAIAEILVKESSYFLAEPHFIAACIPPPSGSTSDVPEHAPKAFALAHVEWLKSFAEEAASQTGEKREAEVIERIEAGRWALRGVMPLLSLESPQAARGFLSIFLSRLVSKHPTLLLPVTPNPKPYTAPPGAEAVGVAPPSGLQLYVTANPDLNFGQMALALSLHAYAAKTTGSKRVPDALKSAWAGLVRQFEREADTLHEDGIGETINPISTYYFQLQAQRPQGNFMQDMLSSLMGGGGAKGANNAIAGSEAKEPAVQPLIIKQAPKPAFKTAEPSSEDPEDAGTAIDAPEEEELD